MCEWKIACHRGIAARATLACIESHTTERTLCAELVGMNTILLVVLILLLLGALPTWPHSSKWGYRPSGGLGLILVVVIILILLGKI